MFVGLFNRSVVRIDEKLQVSSFPKFPGYVQALSVYNDRLYILVSGSPCTVHVYKTCGEFVTKWNHNDNTRYISGLAVVSDQVVVPDRQNKQLVVYTLSGQLVKSISCPLSKHWVSLCAAGADSVIVSDYNASKVFKVSIATGEVKWTNSVTNPQGVTCYGQKSVMVVRSNSSDIKILNTDTG